MEPKQLRISKDAQRFRNWCLINFLKKSLIKKINFLKKSLIKNRDKLKKMLIKNRDKLKNVNQHFIQHNTFDNYIV